MAEVFAELPFLVPLAPPSGEHSWVLDDPEDALAVIEALPRLAGVQALEWPRGKEMRVVPADLPQLSVTVETRNAWYRLVGELRVAEGLVLELGKLIDWTSSHAGRFVPMGQGVYIALTRTLRGRLRDLAGVAEHVPDGIRVPLMATPWLDDVLAGAGVDPDAHFRQRLERLRAARETDITVPANLAAELRPYQHDGYRWAMTLAAAASAPAWPTTWAWARRCRHWRCCWRARTAARAWWWRRRRSAATGSEVRRFAPTLNVLVYDRRRSRDCPWPRRALAIC